MFIKKPTINTVWKYYLFVFFHNLFFISALLVPFFTEWGGISLAKAQFLQSWFMFWIFVLEIPTGAIADYFGRKYSIALGSFMVTIAALVYGSIPKFEVFLLGEFIFAISSALISGADQALLYDALKEVNREEESKKVFGRANSIRLLGLLTAAPLGAFIGQKIGINYTMLFSSIPFFISALIALTIKEPKVGIKISESLRYLDVVKQGFLYFLKHKALRALAVDGIIIASSAYFVIWLYQALLIKLNVPILYFGYFQTFLILMEMLVSSNFGFFDKAFKSPSRYLTLTTCATSLTFIFVAIYPSIISIVVLIIFAGGFGYTRFEYVSALMNKLIDSEKRATVVSSINMFRRFALILLNPLVGFISDHSLRWSFLLVGLLPLAALLFSRIRNKRRLNKMVLYPAQ